MSKYVVVELKDTATAFPGMAVLGGGDGLLLLPGCITISTHKTLEEARAVAEAIAAFKNLPIRTWSL